MKTTIKKTMKSMSALFFAVIMFVCGLSLSIPASAASPSIQYQAHVQNTGWMGIVSNDGVGGTTGRSLRLESLKIRLTNVSGGIKASAHVANIGWMNYVSANSGSWATIGTTGRSLAIEAVKLELYGQAASQYDIFYRVHSDTVGWGSYVKNGAVAGTTGRSLRAEAIQIKLVAKANTTSTSTYYVKTNGTNLTVRSAASTSSSKLGSLSNGTKVDVYSISNNWASIRFNGRTAYVCATYLSKVAPSTSVTPTPGASSSFRWPLSNYYVCGNNWSTYYRSKSGDHLGVDIKSRTGDTNVYAAGAGTIVNYGYNSANGYCVVIKHTVNGRVFYSFYGHLKSYNVSKKNVSAGDRIGVIGNTGSSSTGVHLHFAFSTQNSLGTWGYSKNKTFSDSASSTTFSGYTYYNPYYVISNGRLP